MIAAIVPKCWDGGEKLIKWTDELGYAIGAQFQHMFARNSKANAATSLHAVRVLKKWYFAN